MNRTAKNWKEARRFQAWDLKQQGWSQRQIAEAMGVSAAAVSQWMQRVRQGGPEALWFCPPPGAPRRLTAEQSTQLPDLPAARRRSLRVPRPGMDLRTPCGGQSPGVWRLLPSRSCQPHPATDTVEPAKADAPCPPTRRSSNCPVARPHLAGQPKGAEAQGQTILFVDESGF
jgi:Homeodomain-like domain